ncbi:hypothetical protein EV191_11342 [Tamaricihabitans halophyticus]|uniref:Uncharacterized protein n=1 Tax=Tamaricihabitans halophyticus TaxID=1262583 RepID=A0A4V6NR62_9PSEU|nr:hypothetical protein [Tamaricihabitans halophyticus]TCP46766.1 hypothetical protein EV191_11342 [Tamaricihabitans halophyticus]
MRTLNPLRLAQRWVDWFEARGGYVPGEDNRALRAGREFGWLIAAWLISVGLFIVFFALAT